MNGVGKVNEIELWNSSQTRSRVACFAQTDYKGPLIRVLPSSIQEHEVFTTRTQIRAAHFYLCLFASAEGLKSRADVGDMEAARKDRDAYKHF